MFKTKLLLAVAAIGMSAAAQARFDVTSNSEFAFSAWDASAGVGYTYDLEDAGFNSVFGSNVRLESLLGSGTSSHSTSLLNTTITRTVAGGIIFDLALPSFGDFMSQAAASNVKWNLVAIDNSSVFRLIQTVAVEPGVTSPLNNKGVRDSVNAAAIYFGAVDSKGTMPTADDGVAVTKQTDLTAYAGAGATFGSNFGAKGYANAGGIGDELGLYAFGLSSLATTTTGNNGAARFGALVDSFGNGATASVYLGDDGAYRLQIAVVPEPETYAMLLAGLGLIGFAARRRRA